MALRFSARATGDAGTERRNRGHVRSDRRSPGDQGREPVSRARLPPCRPHRRRPAAKRAGHAGGASRSLRTAGDRDGFGRQDHPIVKNGHFELLDSLKKKLPGELGDMAALPELGPKRIKLLYDKLKVRTLDDLRRAIKTGRIHKLRGFGPVIEQKLASALEKPVTEKRFKLAVAEAEAEALVAFLRDGGRVVVAGSYRRRRDTVGDLDILVTSKQGPWSATNWSAMTASPRCSRRARPARRWCCAQASRSTCARCPSKAMAPRCSILPAPRRITSPCAASPTTINGN